MLKAFGPLKLYLWCISSKFYDTFPPPSDMYIYITETSKILITPCSSGHIALDYQCKANMRMYGTKL